MAQVVPIPTTVQTEILLQEIEHERLHAVYAKMRKRRRYLRVASAISLIVVGISILFSGGQNGVY